MGRRATTSLFLLLALAGAARAEDFALVSWNVQTFGAVKPARQALCREAYQDVLSTGVLVLAIQEIANDKGERIFQSLLPGGADAWSASFQDTSDSQDNALFFRNDRVSAPRRGFLYADAVSGRPDRAKAAHPIRWAHVRVDDFDFTLVTVHLTFKKGDASAAKKELWALLDWLSDYLADPKNDPDVIVAGDFNLPSEKGRLESRRAGEARWMSIESVIREHGKLSEGPSRLTVLVDEPTSRDEGGPVNNYDHFLVSQDVFEEFLSAGRGPTAIPKVSDHYPILGWFRSKGPGVALDYKFARAYPRR